MNVSLSSALSFEFPNTGVSPLDEAATVLENITNAKYVSKRSSAYHRAGSEGGHEPYSPVKAPVKKY